jgi:hypothetical protein
MTTKVELSIAGRGKGDAPLLSDLIEQIQDFFEMVNGVAASMAGDEIARFDWKVVGLSKNSPARVTVEAIPLPGHANGPDIAARARDFTTLGLRQLQTSDVRPIHFNDNVIEAADRFVRRVTRGLAETRVGDGEGQELAVATPDAIKTIDNITLVREADPVHPYRELGSFEGYIENVGTDGWGRPYIVIKSRISGADVKCFLSGAALMALEQEPVANVVWRNRRVTALGILKFRSIGKLSQAEVTQLDFADPAEVLPQLADIIDRDFTHGQASEDYLERIRSGEA